MSVPTTRGGGRSRARTLVLAMLTLAAAMVVPVLAAPAAEAAGLPDGFKSVGHLPSWAGSVNAVQYSKLSHLNYAFVLPRADGTLGAVENPAKLRSPVSLAHAGGVKVLVSIGGWNNGDDSAFDSGSLAQRTQDLRRQPAGDGVPVQPRRRRHRWGIPESRNLR